MSNKPPVRIRRNVEDYDDPYISEECLSENTICTKCGSIYAAGRWYLKDQAPVKSVAAMRHVICPACRKQNQRAPVGVITLGGAFIEHHKDEILNLIRNESSKAQTTNPLERIIDMQYSEGELIITTTNEKLAQRIGRALHKAYSGTVEYRFGVDTKQARVNWYREY